MYKIWDAFEFLLMWCAFSLLIIVALYPLAGGLVQWIASILGVSENFIWLTIVWVLVYRLIRTKSCRFCKDNVIHENPEKREIYCPYCGRRIVKIIGDFEVKI